MSKKIILASASLQRKNLMKHLKMPFSIRCSKAKELTHIQTTVHDLVLKNALLKAKDVASQIKQDALVIGADTVVYAQGKLIMKPKTLKQAKAHLKILMSAPHWVYTALAIVDAVTGKTVTAVEKTKVFMRTLSDAEIDRYYQEISFQDKAGGFDIEGRGALFIWRIEGCYFNVVGLPIASLTKLLKKHNVFVL